MTADLAFTSAAELARLIAGRQVSPVEVVDGVLDRIERSQPVLNAFITVCAEEARAAAKGAAATVMRGEALGPLHGVPFAVKDLVNTAGVRTTLGSVALAENIPAGDSPAVARLKAAGAILVGKTTTPEFGHKCFTEAPLFGRTANPWDQSRTPGGSSGGAAAAVAAGLGPIGIGTDGGGSSRIPAACCGIVGFKQTIGLVPHDLTPDGFGNQSHITPLTRTVMDAALMLEAMAGPDPCDPHSLGLPAPDFVSGAKAEGDLRGVRIAWRPLLGNSMVAGLARQVVLEALRSLGKGVDSAGVVSADDPAGLGGAGKLPRILELLRPSQQPAGFIVQTRDSGISAKPRRRRLHHRAQRALDVGVEWRVRCHRVLLKANVGFEKAAEFQHQSVGVAEVCGDFR